jgi:DNA-binding NarL/FixJ family response regulator
VNDAPITVVLIDDHAPTRAGVRMALEPAGFEVVAEAATASEGVTAALGCHPALCLVDLFLPGDGIQAVREIAAELPETEIVMLTIAEDEEHLLAALQAGAQGYLLKTTAADRLPEVLRHVIDGEVALPRAMVGTIVHELRERRVSKRRALLRHSRTDASVSLTPREHEVLSLLAEDLPTGEIAHRLDISPVTVRRHVSALFAKAAAGDRKTLLSLARRVP